MVLTISVVDGVEDYAVDASVSVGVVDVTWPVYRASESSHR